MNKPLIDTLPSSLAQDKNVKDIAKTIESLLQEVEDDTDKILLLANIDSMGDALLDTLAWQYHVDFYDYSASLEEKRYWIKKSIVIHMKKGTPKSVEDACAAKARAASVKEWFEYGGQPYRFRISLPDVNLMDDEELNKQIDIVNETKNVRSWLDGIMYQRNVDSTIWAKAALHSRKRYEFYPTTFTMQDIGLKVKPEGGANAIYREVTINE